MLRALVLIAAFFFFRAVLSRKPKSCSSAMSPYMNSLDGMMSADQISQALDNYAKLKVNRLKSPPLSDVR
jgi:hypothetical protein